MPLPYLAANALCLKCSRQIALAFSQPTVDAFDTEAKREVLRSSVEESTIPDTFITLREKDMALPKNKRPVATVPPVASKTAAPVRQRTASVSHDALKEKQAAGVKTTEKALKKEKRVRSSFSLPESQFLLLAELKARCASFDINPKKSELLAAGLQLLNDLPETSLEASILPCLRSDRKVAKIKKQKK